jgi:hypothetical protein
MPAWTDPDPQLQPVTRLSERVQLQVDEQRGAWARVTGSNGWTGWIDARRLQPIGTVTAATPSATAAPAGGIELGGLNVRLLCAVGAVLGLIAVVLPWLTPPGAGGSSNAFDVPTAFLWDYEASGGLKLGVIVLAVAIIGLIVSFVMPLDARIAGAMGVVALAIGLVFVIQVVRAIGEFDLSFGDAISDWVGFGAWMTVGGGVLMLVGGLSDR